jgi:hypothetical protein
MRCLNRFGDPIALAVGGLESLSEQRIGGGAIDEAFVHQIEVQPHLEKLAQQRAAPPSTPFLRRAKQATAASIAKLSLAFRALEA